jgi:hypothetical protein
MANGDNSGRIVGFNMSEKELDEKIQQYKDMVKAGDVVLPYWTDFREFLGILQDALDEVMERGYFGDGARESAYHERALMIKRMGETCENYLNTHPNWGGKNAVKSMMLLKQGLGYTKKYTDERTTTKETTGRAKVTIESKDPRVKDMAK